MHTEYFHRWMDLLVARLEPGERVLARGRAFEPRDALGLDLAMVISGPGCAVAVTERRVLWVSRDDQRRVRSLPFALVRSYTEITQAHRYALALDHQRIDRRQWVPAHQLLWWSWGNAEAVRPVTSSVLAFSRRDTTAARAIRSRLQAVGVPAGEPRSLPHVRPSAATEDVDSTPARSSSGWRWRAAPPSPRGGSMRCALIYGVPYTVLKA
jgi:hypothetical protein